MTGSEFKAWRKRMGYTQELVCDLFLISRRSLGYYETGERPLPQRVISECESLEQERAVRAQKTADRPPEPPATPAMPPVKKTPADARERLARLEVARKAMMAAQAQPARKESLSGRRESRYGDVFDGDYREYEVDKTDEFYQPSANEVDKRQPWFKFGRRR